MSISHNLQQLRSLMHEAGVTAYIIPSSDPHQGEYVADHWAARSWISGFTGSAGTVVVTAEDAGVWTDSRYFIQAESELENGPFSLHKVVNSSSPQYIDWILDNLGEGDTVGCDGRLFSKKLLAGYEKRLSATGISLEPSVDLLAAVWEDRPVLPTAPIYEIGIEYAGESRASKLKRIRAEMKKVDCQCHLMSTLDDIAWTFNVRGTDVSFNPVAYAYALITPVNATLYLDLNKVEPGLRDILEHENIGLKNYNVIWEDANKLPSEAGILIDENTVSYSLYKAINAGRKVNKTLPSIRFKAVKNEVEIQHFRNVMEKDGVALVRFYMWLEGALRGEPTEYELAEKIAAFRSEQAGYVSESFNAIVGWKGNGAIVHYKPSAEGSAKIGSDGLLLIDSGGQYTDGTTDITRTISVGVATEEERKAYTQVLKGNIELDRAVFPEGTTGVQLDTLARIHLWRSKKNYLHGTGHGIGFFLNVHEGPQGFYPGIAARSRVSIDEHMITTNEPGYYEEGKYGIRIENCLLTVKAGVGFLKFETLTLFPIATNLIDMPSLTREEVEWLNDYHEMVYERLSPYLDSEEREWLSIKCASI